MIALDTNVIIRYLVQDDKKQAELATRIIEKYRDKPGTIFISQIVLCEIDWVLKRSYNVSRVKRLQILKQLPDTLEFNIEKHDTVRSAIEKCVNTGLEFSDCLIGVSAHSYGCKNTFTFDKKAGNTSLFKLLK